jgi:hypothetical protein
MPISLSMGGNFRGVIQVGSPGSIRTPLHRNEFKLLLSQEVSVSKALPLLQPLN